LDSLVVITALPAVHREIGGSLSSLEWTVNAYTVAVAAGIITAAAIGDRLGRRRVYIVGLYLFSAASAACALAPSVDVLIAARAALDVPGLAFVTVGAVSLLWGLIRSTDVGWTSNEVLIAIGLGALLMIGFVLWESRAPAPMLPLRLLTIRPFATASGTAFLMSGSIMSAAFLASQFFQFGLGYSPFDTGLRFLPWTGTAFIVAPIAGRLSDRIGTRPLMVVGLLMNATGLAWMSQIAGAGVGYGQL